MEDLTKAIAGFITTLGGLFLFFGSIAAIILFALGLFIVPATFGWAKLTGVSYDRVCDNSQIVYTLNQIGKWVWVFTLGSVLVLGLVLLFV